VHNIQLLSLKYLFYFPCDCPTSITNFPAFVVYLYIKENKSSEKVYIKKAVFIVKPSAHLLSVLKS